MGAFKKKDYHFNGTVQSLAGIVSEIISKESGNVLGPKQQSMVISRLNKRLIDLGRMEPAEYYDFLFSHYKTEVAHLMSLLTTHHTFFFREYGHFEYIDRHLSELVNQVKSRGDNKIRVLSAACSRGHEVYSLAMFFEEKLKRFPGMDYKILGTDIDPVSVDIAKKGVYRYKEVKSIPRTFLAGNWQRGVGKISEYARVKDHLKSHCRFDVMNLLDVSKPLHNKRFDLIFCRNVLIYFDSHVVEKLVVDLKPHLYDHGLLITGLSESLKFTSIKMNNLAPSIYSFSSQVPTSENSGAGAPAPTQNRQINADNPLRVLVVDDSPSVVKLLSHAFKSDPHFELVGTAGNGKQAEEFLKTHEVDAMTLDIHMPEMDGVEYLKRNHSRSHPPVVMVSSASREDTRYSQKAMEYGASDFVEKPAMNNLEERAEEIKIKLKMAVHNSQTDNLCIVDRSFERKFQISDTQNKARIFFGTYSDIKKISEIINSFEGDQPPLFLIFEGCKNYFLNIKEQLSSIDQVEIFGSESVPNSNSVYICDFREHMDELSLFLHDKQASFSVFGIASNKTTLALSNMSEHQILVEDIEGQNKKAVELAHDHFPWTSFGHVGTEYLSGGAE